MAPLVTTTRDFAFFAAHVCPITLIIQRINAQFQLWVLPLHTAFFFFKKGVTNTKYTELSVEEMQAIY